MPNYDYNYRHFTSAGDSMGNDKSSDLLLIHLHNINGKKGRGFWLVLDRSWLTGRRWPRLHSSLCPDVYVELISISSSMLEYITLELSDFWYQHSE